MRFRREVHGDDLRDASQVPWAYDLEVLVHHSFIVDQLATIVRPCRTAGDCIPMRDTPKSRAVAADDVNLGRVHGGKSVLRLLRLAVRRERDPLPVGRPGRTKIAGRMIREVAQCSRRQLQHPDVRLTASARDEGQRLRIWRERALIIEGGIVRQLLQSRAVGVHAIDVGRAVAFRSEDDPLAVGRERRVVVVGRMRKERSRATAVAGSDEDVGIQRGEARERDRVRDIALALGARTGNQQE